MKAGDETTAFWTSPAAIAVDKRPAEIEVIGLDRGACCVRGRVEWSWKGKLR